MTHYTPEYKRCRVCGERREGTEDYRVAVCARCIRPLANKICQEVLKADLGPGIDENYFVRRAYGYAEILLGRK